MFLPPRYEKFSDATEASTVLPEHVRLPTYLCQMPEPQRLRVYSCGCLRTRSSFPVLSVQAPGLSRGQSLARENQRHTTRCRILYSCCAMSRSVCAQSSLQ